MNAEELLARHEGKTLEFKREATSKGPILRTLSAFSNTAGGVLVIGVEDGTRRVVGLRDPLRAEEQIANLAADGIHPQILPEVEILPHRGRSLLAVTVFPGPSRPYYVRQSGREHGTYVRVGSTNRRAAAEMLAELERTARNVTYDEQPMTSVGRGELDLELARRRFAGHRDLGPRDFLTLGLTVRESRREVATVGGVLLFSPERLRHFPDARIRLARFSGSDRASVLDRADVETDPIESIDAALAFVRLHTMTGMKIEGARRRDLPQYPPAALREAIVNAVVHADYSQTGSPIRIAVFEDRIEIENPGLLPFGLTVDEIRRGVSKLRNRVVGRVFHEVGLIEQWGSGIQRMTRACEEMGLPAPELEEIGTHFRVTLRCKPSSQDAGLTGTGQRIHDLLGDDAARSTSDIATALGVTPRTVRTHLKRLVEHGLIVEIGESATDPRRVYRRARP